ncbi:MAG: amino acid ABC transporter permease [Winkia neuii]|uniref:Amino acid ABC transporter permease n=1 Tax=Winkia neuii TaxID=33007 RepID=A0A2I1IQ19_9ACTO|nr:amino acid ABC transporter permease [Winkia neuii]OFJ72223.1 amino acid ABC transporter permease [Actinomyces sp. HMSC064C12]OFK01938.1 amino acid ABC transporter permease [Actinomyces sp. HMSC072A03]OFT54566.1 amino acid ABC transporter permease [Actinomyces sp. HMSC06A08]KWZ74294.1 putative glutamine ABC transporter permease protein GlnM [Winkia neuii]MDK8098720.1 amino acid ABC transporter permease [Winkia neuii]
MHLIVDNFGLLLAGLGRTLVLAVLGYAGALVLGTVIAIFRVSPVPVLRGFGTVYVEFFRNIPLLTLLILTAFGLPDAGLQIGFFGSALAAIVMSSAAFVCETIRSGINTVSVGQSEAARALGLNMFQQLRHIILPQAFTSMIQPLVNVFIGALIGTSLAAAVGVPELTNITQQLNIKYAEAVLLFLVSGICYLVIALGAGALGGYLQRRVDARHRIDRASEGAAAVDRFEVEQAGL